MSRRGICVLEAAVKGVRTVTQYGGSTPSAWINIPRTACPLTVFTAGAEQEGSEALSALWLRSMRAISALPQHASAAITKRCATKLEQSSVPWVGHHLLRLRRGVSKFCRAPAASSIGCNLGSCSSNSVVRHANVNDAGKRRFVHVYGNRWHANVGSMSAGSTRPLILPAARPQWRASLPSEAVAAVVAGGVIETSTGSALAWGPAANVSGAVRCVWRDSRGYEHFQGRGQIWSLHNLRVVYGAGAMALAAVAYYLYCMETVPYTGRRHSIMLVSPYREQWMGKMGFEQFKALARAEHKLLPDSHHDVQRVRRLGSAIAAVAADGGGSGSYEHMRGLQWEFAVINDGMVNAAVLPGGKVIVFSGLLKLLNHNDDELAAVLAHEVGHVLARHPAESMSTLNVWLLINTALRLTLGFALPDVAMYLALILPNSRKNEHEADAIGLWLMARACFDPSAATTMLDKLNKAENEMKNGRMMGASLPPFLSTHPLTTDRVKLLEKDLPAAYKLFENSGCASRRGDFRRVADAWMGGVW